MVISALSRVGIEILFANPEVRFAAGVDVFGDDRSGILNCVPRDLHSFELTLRYVDVQQGSLKQPLFQHFPGSKNTECRRLLEVEVLAGNQTECESRHATYRSFQRTCNCT